MKYLAYKKKYSETYTKHDALWRFKNENVSHCVKRKWQTNIVRGASGSLGECLRDVFMPDHV